MSSFSNDEKAKTRPILIIDHLTKDFGIHPKKREKNEKNINKNEEHLLTLIANVIVEIILKEEL